MKGAVVISLKLKARTRYRDYNGTAVGRQEGKYYGMQNAMCRKTTLFAHCWPPNDGSAKIKAGSDGSTTPVADERYVMSKHHAFMLYTARRCFIIVSFHDTLNFPFNTATVFEPFDQELLQHLSLFPSVEY